MPTYKTCEEIRETFIKKGWSQDIEFEMISPEQMTKDGHLGVPNKPFFKMMESGNIFDCHGKVYCFNIPASLETPGAPMKESRKNKKQSFGR